MASKYEFNLVDDSHSHLSPTSLKNLTLKNVPIPEPGPGSVLVRMHAAALNFRDLLTVADSPMYPVRSLPGLVPCSDGAGEIVKTGQDSAWSDNIGQAVILVPGRDWIDGVCNVRTDNVLGAGNLDGTLTQYAVVPDMWLLRCPKNLSYEEAAALVSTAGTALNCLETFNLKKGDTVVAQGTGGVSCAVIQYASALGAKVIATSSSPEKLKIAKELGASEFINYKATPDWAEEVLRITDGKGADYVVDVTGLLEPTIKALKQGGAATLVGMLGGGKELDVVMPLLLGVKTLTGILMYSKKTLQRAITLAEEHNIHPKMEEPYAWEDALKAFERLKSQDFVGKIVIKM